MRVIASPHPWTALLPSTSWCWTAGRKRGTTGLSSNRSSASWINSFATLVASKSRPTRHPGIRRIFQPFVFVFLFVVFVVCIQKTTDKKDTHTSLQVRQEGQSVMLSCAGLDLCCICRSYLTITISLTLWACCSLLNVNEWVSYHRV